MCVQFPQPPESEPHGQCVFSAPPSFLSRVGAAGPTRLHAAAALSCRDPGLCLDSDRCLEVPAERVRWAESEGGRDRRRNGRREPKAARTRFSLTRPRVAVPKPRDAPRPRRSCSCGRGGGDGGDSQVEKVVTRRRKVLGTQPCSTARTGGCAFCRVSHWAPSVTAGEPSP